MTQTKLAFFDIDNTIYDGHIIFHLAVHQERSGLLHFKTTEEIFDIGLQYKMGVLDYESAVQKHNVAWSSGLKDKDYSAVKQNAFEYLKSQEHQFFPYFAKILPRLNQTYNTYLVTAEPQFVTDAIATMFPVKNTIHSIYEIKNNLFTGKIVNQLDKKEDKLSAIRAVIKEHSLKGSFAFGDSEGDIEMLSAVENPICVNPTSELKEVAEANNWAILSPEKIALYINRRLKLSKS